MPKSTATVAPNLGLYLDRPAIGIPPGGLQDGLNFRVQAGKLHNINLGWAQFQSALNGPLILIVDFIFRNGSHNLILGTQTDLYKYNNGSPLFITPSYTTGTASASGTSVTGSGTLWNTTPAGSTWKNAKAGDQISFGSASQNNPAATWFTIQSVNSDTSLTLTSSAGSIGNGAYTLRQRFTAGTSTQWQTEVFANASPQNEDQIFFTNGVDNVMRWNGTSTFVTQMTTLGFTCKSLVNFKNMMVYLNVTYNGVFLPTTIINSDVGQPSNAGNASTGLSGQFILYGTTDPIYCGRRLGDYLAVYSAKRITMVYFTGDDTVFVFRSAVEGKGPVGPNAVAVWPDHHKFLGLDMFYNFDGTTARYEAEQVWRGIMPTLDPARIGFVFSTVDEQQGEVIWSTPLTSDPGAGTMGNPPVYAYVEHYLERMPPQTPQPWSKRQFPFLCSGSFLQASTQTWNLLTNQWKSYNFAWNNIFFAASFPQVLAGDSTGKTWWINSQQDIDGGIALPSFVKFGRRPLVDGNMRALVARVYPFVEPFSTPLSITVNLADHAMGPATIVNVTSFDQTLPQGLYFSPIYRVGRYVDMQYGTAGPAQPYRLSGYDTQIRPGGYR